MYWDNNKIGEVYSARNFRALVKFEKARRRYINDELFCIHATWTFGDNAFRKDGEFKKAVVHILNSIDDAVFSANKTIDSDFEIEDDYLLSFIEEDDFIEVVGMTTDSGSLLIENAFLPAADFGEISFKIK